MGYSLSWIAIRGATPTAIEAALGLSRTGRQEEIAESPFNGAQLASGWYVVIADHELDLVDEDRVAPVLAMLPGCEGVSCAVEEHAMVSMASGWRDGRQSWSVAHDSSASLSHLEATGALPPALEKIRSDALAASTADPNGADHIFDIPVALAESLCGFRHDAYEGPFEVLERIPVKGSKRVGWLRSLFGA